VSSWRLDCADAAHLPWPANQANLIACSPPYNLGLPYAGVDDHRPFGEYARCVQAWADELFRIATDQGRACINVPLDTHNGGRRPVYGLWVAAMQAAGWQYRTTIVWTKGGRGDTHNHLARGSIDSPSGPNVIAGVEMIPVFFKGTWIRDRAGRTADLTRAEWLAWTDGLWDFPPISRRPGVHPARFPPELPRRLIKLHAFVEDLVVDPFVGSGTTLQVALELERRCWAADLSAQYVTELELELARREVLAA
jgi:site-specific DNA-methyltransferase (adenine-specific)